MFEPAAHPYTGTVRAYIPQGYSPYALDPYRHADNALILPAGDLVSVISAWSRPYLPNGGEILLHVMSHTTGIRTHVTAGDLPLTAPTN